VAGTQVVGPEISTGEKEAGRVVPATGVGALPVYLMSQVVSKKDHKPCWLTSNQPVTALGGLSQQPWKKVLDNLT